MEFDMGLFKREPNIRQSAELLAHDVYVEHWVKVGEQVSIELVGLTRGEDEQLGDYEITVKRVG
jgi:hypothetical protein